MGGVTWGGVTWGDVGGVRDRQGGAGRVDRVEEAMVEQGGGGWSGTKRGEAGWGAWAWPWMAWAVRRR